MQPAGDAAAPAVLAVMVLDALAPGGAEGRILGMCEDHGILARDDRLIAVAVQRPGLHLGLRQRAAGHPVMERVAVVIALGTDLPQHGFELAAGQTVPGRVVEIAHNSISMPSWATSQPAALTAACSAEFSSRTGLVLLMWTKMRRPILNVGQAGDRARPLPTLPDGPCARRSFGRRRRQSSRRRCRPCRRTAGRRHRPGARAAPHRSGRSPGCRRPSRRLPAPPMRTPIVSPVSEPKSASGRLLSSR